MVDYSIATVRKLGSRYSYPILLFVINVGLWNGDIYIITDHPNCFTDVMSPRFVSFETSQ